MPTLPIYQVDAFTSEVFRGNPAAVCPLEQWIPDEMMQAIAAENNLSETAFFVPLDDDGHYHLRWFTPRREVPLCGHATLATAHVLLNILNPQSDCVVFKTKSGALTVNKDEAWLTMDFPAYTFQPAELDDHILSAFPATPTTIYKGGDYETRYYLVYDSEDIIPTMKVNMSIMETAAPYGFAITAPGKDYDCVSRYFSPSSGIGEDPVTGSLHSSLVPYWAKTLGKNNILAYQASARGGVLRCEYHPERERVTIQGQAVSYLQGTITLPE